MNSSDYNYNEKNVNQYLSSDGSFLMRRVFCCASMFEEVVRFRCLTGGSNGPMLDDPERVVDGPHCDWVLTWSVHGWIMMDPSA